MIGSHVPFNCFSYFRVGPTRGSSQIWGSKFSDANYSRTIRDINDLFYGNERFMYPLSPFHNFGSIGPVVPPEFGGQNFQTQITREPYEILTICFLQMIGSYVPFNCFPYFRVGPTRGSSQIWGSKFSDADYKRTIRHINDLFFADDMLLFPSIAFHNFGWVRTVVPSEFGGQIFQTQITDYKRTVRDINDLFFADDRFICSLQLLFIL